MKLKSFTILLGLYSLAFLLGNAFAQTQTLPNFAIFEGQEVAQLPTNTFICKSKLATVVAADQSLQPISYFLTSLALEAKKLSKEQKKLKKKPVKNRVKKLKSIAKKIKQNQKFASNLKKKAKLCAKGKFKIGGSSTGALGAGVSIDSTNPAPDSQGFHVYTSLPVGINGGRYLEFVGNGFQENQRLRVQIGPRVLYVSHKVTDDSHFRIRVQPVTLDFDVSVEQQTPLGLVSSNTMVVHLKAGSIVGGVGEQVATLIQELPTVSGVLPQPSDYVLNAVIPVPDKLILAQEVQSGMSHFTIEPMLGGAAVALDSTPIELSNDGQFITKLEVRARVARAMTSASPVPNSQFKVVYYPSPGAPVSPVAPGSDVRALLNSAPFPIDPSILTLFPGGLKVESVDMHGNIYSCDADHQQFGNLEIYHWTRASVGFAVHCVTQPVSPNSTTLPRLLNAKLYFELSREAAMRITVVIGNTIAGKVINANNSLAIGFGDLPFRSFSIKARGSFGAKYSWHGPVAQPTVIQAGWTTFNIDPVRSDNAMHLMEHLKQEVVELAIHSLTPQAEAAADMYANYRGLAFTKGGTNSSGLQLYSYHENIYTGGIGITKGIPGSSFTHFGVPAIRTYLTSRYNSFANQVASGTCPLKYNDVTISNNGTSTLSCDDIKERHYFCDPYLASDSVQNAVLPLQYQGSCPGSGSWVVVPGNGQPIPVPLKEATMKADGVAYGGMTSGTDIIPDTGLLESASFSNDGTRELLMKAVARSLRREYLQLLSGRYASPLDVMQNTSQGQVMPVDISPFGEWSTNKFSLAEFANSPSASHLNAATSSNLMPSDHVHFDPDDWQHYIRFVYRVVAAVSLTNHPYMRDMLQVAGYQAYFARPSLPQTYNGSGPVFQFGSQSLPGLVPSTPGVGGPFGRAEAWIYSTAAVAYSLYGNDSYRALMLPYFEYLTHNVLSASQMWTGLLLKTSYTAKLYPDGNSNPACACQATGSPTREAGYAAIGIHAVLKRALEGVSPMASELQNVLVALAGARLVKPFISPNNNWHAMFKNGGALSAVANPNQLFTDWNQVSPVCQNALLNSSSTAQGGCPGSAGPDAGESHYMVTVSDLELPNSAQWDELRLNLKNSYPDPIPSNPEPALTKMRKLSIYSIDRNYNALLMAMGYCEYLLANNLAITCG